MAERTRAQDCTACLQSTSACKTWDGRGDALDGTLQSCADVEFKLTTDANGKDVISMLPVKAPRNRNTEFLVKHIAKFQKIVQDFSDMAPAGAAPPKVAAY